MRNIVYTILSVLLSFGFASYSEAQVDPGLTAMIVEYTNKAKSQYNSQLETMAMETEGHVWLNGEVKYINNFQREFDNYLSTFRTIISYAAQTYGFYYEVSNLCQNMGKLTAQIGDTPVNAIAVGASQQEKRHLCECHQQEPRHREYHSASVHRQEDDGEAASRVGLFHTSPVAADEQGTCHVDETREVYQHGAGVVWNRT